MPCQKSNGAVGIGVGAVNERNVAEEVVHIITEVRGRLLDWGLLNGLLNGEGVARPVRCQSRLFVGRSSSRLAVSQDDFATTAGPLTIHKGRRPVNISNHGLGGSTACSVETGLVLQTQLFIVLLDVLDVSAPLRSRVRHLSSCGRSGLGSGKRSSWLP